VDLEDRGLPGVFVASDRFAQAADAQGRALGMHPRRVFTTHPIQDRTDEEMRALAEAAFPEILGALTV
jgi:alkanesulfonate monooxygenase SsuD/methylene tetrahydromethanopterin reductase-like flavin-dependent oxidoreductase (luciferase family)